MFARLKSRCCNREFNLPNPLETWCEKHRKGDEMANYQKYSKGAMGHLMKHYERGKDEYGEYVKFGNQKIDPTRTHLNYNLAPQHNQLDFIHKRLNQVKCLKRKDVNVMCSWVITAPKDLPKEDEARFFEKTYECLCAKYGSDNVISAYVHYDEETPHMHFVFVPVVVQHVMKDNTLFDILKVSAKECVTRAHLQTFHMDLQNYLSKEGIYCSILNEATKEGNKAISQLKRGTAIAELNRIREDVHNLSERCGKVIEGCIESYKKRVEYEKKYRNLDKNENVLMKTFLEQPEFAPVYAEWKKARIQQIDNDYNQKMAGLQQEMIGIKVAEQGIKEAAEAMSPKKKKSKEKER